MSQQAPSDLPKVMFDDSRVLTALVLSFEIWTKADSGVCRYPSRRK